MGADFHGAEATLESDENQAPLIQLVESGVAPASLERMHKITPDTTYVKELKPTIQTFHLGLRRPCPFAVVKGYVQYSTAETSNTMN